MSPFQGAGVLSARYQLDNGEAEESILNMDYGGYLAKSGSHISNLTKLIQICYTV